MEEGEILRSIVKNRVTTSIAWSALRKLYTPSRAWQREVASSIELVKIWSTNSYLVSRGGYHVYAMGMANDSGQLGLGHTSAVGTPHEIVELEDRKVRSIVCNYQIVFAIAEEQEATHQLWAWGSLTQLLHLKVPKLQLWPTPVVGVTDCEKVVVGEKFAMVLKRNGTLVVCDAHCVRHKNKEITFRELEFDDDDDFIVDIAAGAHHALAMTAQGKLLGYGQNVGQALGDTGKTTEMTKLGYLRTESGDPIENVCSVACGETLSAYLDHRGQLFLTGGGDRLIQFTEVGKACQYLYKVVVLNFEHGLPVEPRPEDIKENVVACFIDSLCHRGCYFYAQPFIAEGNLTFYKLKSSIDTGCSVLTKDQVMAEVLLKKTQELKRPPFLPFMIHLAREGKCTTPKPAHTFRNREHNFISDGRLIEELVGMPRSTVDLPTLVDNLPRSLSTEHDFVVNIEKVKLWGKNIYFVGKNNRVYAVGEENGSGELGLGHRHSVPRPTEIVELAGRRVLDIVCGHQVVFAIAFDDHTYQLWAWGELGNLTNNTQSCSKLRPVKCSGVTQCHAVVVCKHVVLVLRKNRELLIGTSASNEQGLVFRALEKSCPADEYIAQVACGHSHFLIRYDSGRLFGAGSNRQGQLGYTHGRELITEPKQLLMPQNLEDEQSQPVVNSVWVEAKGNISAFITNYGEVLLSSDLSGRFTLFEREISFQPRTMFVLVGGEHFEQTCFEQYLLLFESFDENQDLEMEISNQEEEEEEEEDLDEYEEQCSTMTDAEMEEHIINSDDQPPKSKVKPKWRTAVFNQFDLHGTVMIGENFSVLSPRITLPDTNVGSALLECTNLEAKAFPMMLVVDEEMELPKKLPSVVRASLNRRRMKPFAIDIQTSKSVVKRVPGDGRFELKFPYLNLTDLTFVHNGERKFMANKDLLVQASGYFRDKFSNEWASAGQVIVLDGEEFSAKFFYKYVECIYTHNLDQEGLGDEERRKLHELLDADGTILVE